MGGAGFVLAISARWAEPEQAYRDWFAQRERSDFGFGRVQFVRVEPDLWVANMIAIRRYRVSKHEPSLHYESLRECLECVADFASRNDASVHMSRIGAGLGGGDWGRIKALIDETLGSRKLKVFVYEFAADSLGVRGKKWTRSRDR